MEAGSNLQKKIENILAALRALTDQTNTEKMLIQDITNKLDYLLSNKPLSAASESIPSHYIDVNYENLLEEKENLENLVTSLNERVSKLEEENKDHIEKNELLKTALLLHIDSETADVHEMEAKGISIPIPPSQKEKQDNVITIEDAMKAQQEETQTISKTTFEKEEVQPEVSEKEIMCPICKNSVEDLISEIYDEEGKKFKCNKCSYIWR